MHQELEALKSKERPYSLLTVLILILKIQEK